MTETITQLGVGGILVVVVLQIILPYFKKNGNGGVSRKEFDEHRKSVQYRDTCGEIVKRIDNNFTDVKDQLNDIKTLIRNGQK